MRRPAGPWAPSRRAPRRTVQASGAGGTFVVPGRSLLRRALAIPADRLDTARSPDHVDRRRSACPRSPGKREMPLSWPNRITLFRMVLSPILVVLMLDGRTGFRIAAFAVFVFAALTDLYDGYLARRYGWTTNLGKFLDPLADKLLVSFVLVALVSVGLIPVWAAYLIIGRELLVTGLRSVAAYAGVLILPSSLGKWKATVQMIALTLYMTLALLKPGSRDEILILRLEQVSIAVLFVAIVLTVVSGIDYFWRNRGVVRRLLM